MLLLTLRPGHKRPCSFCLTYQNTPSWNPEAPFEKPTYSEVTMLRRACGGALADSPSRAIPPASPSYQTSEWNPLDPSKRVHPTSWIPPSDLCNATWNSKITQPNCQISWAKKLGDIIRGCCFYPLSLGLFGSQLWKTGMLSNAYLSFTRTRIMSLDKPKTLDAAVLNKHHFYFFLNYDFRAMHSKAPCKYCVR